jgi:hypothetical protein
MTDVAPRARILLVLEGREVPFGAIDAGEPLDLTLVDELCKLRLAAIRQGLAVRLVDVQRELHELLAFVGVAHLAGLDPYCPMPCSSTLCSSMPCSSMPGSSMPCSSMRDGRPNSAKRWG